MVHLCHDLNQKENLSLSLFIRFGKISKSEKVAADQSKYIITTRPAVAANALIKAQLLSSRQAEETNYLLVGSSLAQRVQIAEQEASHSHPAVVHSHSHPAVVHSHSHPAVVQQSILYELRPDKSCPQYF